MHKQDSLLISWSGGKDCLTALDYVTGEGSYRVAALITSISLARGDAEARVPIHELRAGLLARQAACLDLPLSTVTIPSGATNDEYEAAWLVALRGIREEMRAAFAGDLHPQIAFGDLFLEDVRFYRERLLARGGWRGLFPLWGRDTREIAKSFIRRGNKAIITSVDRTRLDASFVGELFTENFLARLPPEVDPCGERGEFHTFVFDGNLFREPVQFAKGEVHSTETHHICDLIPIER